MFESLKKKIFAIAEFNNPEIRAVRHRIEGRMYSGHPVKVIIDELEDFDNWDKLFDDFKKRGMIP